MAYEIAGVYTFRNPFRAKHISFLDNIHTTNDIPQDKDLQAHNMCNLLNQPASLNA